MYKYVKIHSASLAAAEFVHVRTATAAQRHSGESRRCSLEKVFSLLLIARSAARFWRACIGHPAALPQLPCPGQPAAATAYRWFEHSADSRDAQRRTSRLPLQAALPVEEGHSSRTRAGAARSRAIAEHAAAQPKRCAEAAAWLPSVRDCLLVAPVAGTRK